MLIFPKNEKEIFFDFLKKMKSLIKGKVLHGTGGGSFFYLENIKKVISPLKY